MHGAVLHGAVLHGAVLHRAVLRVRLSHGVCWGSDVDPAHLRDEGAP
ncbi:hypothetical protein [Streptomyces sp. BH055]